MDSLKKYITVGITTGEPAGIGPDICLKIANQNHNGNRLIFIGCSELLKSRAKLLGLNIPFNVFDNIKHYVYKKGYMNVLNEPAVVTVKPGELDKQNSSYVLTVLQKTLQGTLEGHFDAMVTAPVHKGIINASGYHFIGHTEWLAEKTNTSRVVMMFSCSSLRLALVTTHVPLSQVSANINVDMLSDTLTILYNQLVKLFGIKYPRIRVCGLNPHAGENGYLGCEELNIINPVIHHLYSQGMNITGPFSADTIFNQGSLEVSDAIVAMYHDQGLPVFKYKSFGHSVNISLGLPIIRTSVDHGVAIDLAGTGMASSSSLNYAVNFTIDMVKNTTNQ